MTDASYPMRRKDRELTREDALRIVRAAPFAVLSTAGADSRPYGVPVNAVYLDGAIYFHGTTGTSRKADNLAGNPAVSLCFTAYERCVPGEYSTDYACAVVDGTAELVTDEAERTRAFVAISRAHAQGDNDEVHLERISKGGAYARVWRVRILQLSGKSRSWPMVSKELPL